MRKSLWAACAATILIGCGHGNPELQATQGTVYDALARKSLGGTAYANFFIDPNLPKAHDERNAVKLTYLMTDDLEHQSDWSWQMLSVLDNLPVRSVHNVVFRDGDQMGDSRLYYLQGDDAPFVKAAQSLLAEKVTEVQSDNPRIFSQILAWTFNRYHGRRNFLHIYSHGAGVFGLGMDSHQTDPRGNLLRAEQHLDSMPLADFGEALRQGLKGHKLDLLYFRACLMGNMEVLYELRDSTKYVVASEDLSQSVANSNFTMTRALDEMADAGIDPAEIARQLSIMAHAKDPDQPSGFSGYKTIAAVDMAKVNDMKTALNSLAIALINSKEKDAILEAYDSVPTVRVTEEPCENYDQLRDLWNFTTQLVHMVPDKAVQDAVTRLRNAQRAAMLYERDAHGSAANGVSILMPFRDQLSKYRPFIQGPYQETRFAQDSAWDDFLLSLPEQPAWNGSK